MGLWAWILGDTSKSEQRATLSEVDFWLRDGWTQTVASGMSVTPESAMAVPDVYAAVSVLAQDVGRAPLKLRVRDSVGEWHDATEHPLWEVLHDLPNPEMTASEFRSTMQRSLLAHEVAYAEIVRSASGQVVALWPLDSSRMTVSRDELNVKRYHYKTDTRVLQWTFNPDRPPILELRHPSPIHRCRDLIGLAMALDTYAAKYFANGSRLSGILSAPGSLKPEQRQGIKDAFDQMHKGANNAHKVGVFEGGLEFKPLTIPNNEAQFNETRKQIRTMIAGAFRVPPHKIGDLERATFSNIEAQDRDYVNASLSPFLVLWEQSIRRDLLTTRQYPRCQAIFDREALIESDSQSRSVALSIGRQNGWWSVNDVRRKLHENPVPQSEGGNEYHMNGNMIPLTGAPMRPAAGDPARQPDAAPEAYEQVM